MKGPQELTRNSQR